MNAQLHPELITPDTQTNRRSLLLYEDLAAADEGIAFASRLNSEVGLDIDYPDAHWWLEMLEVPSVAAQISRQVLVRSHVILSLGSSAELSDAKKQWLEAWLANPHAESLALLVLFDPERSEQSRISALRQWLQRAAADTGIRVFFYGIEELVASSESEAVGVELVDEDEDDGAEWFIGALDTLAA